MSSWLWVLFEGQASPVKVDASNLSSIPSDEIQFLSSNNYTQPLSIGTLITSIHTTDISPLVVSGSGTNGHIPVDFDIFCSTSSSSTESFRMLQLIMVSARSAYSYELRDLRDVLQNILYKSSWSSLSSAPRLNLDEFDKVEVSDDALKLLIDELQKNADVFGKVTTVKHLQVNEPLLAFRAEDELNRSHGFGLVNYTVVLNDILICATEAKKMDFNKGAAQNIVQMHSAVESLSKRKQEDTHLEDSEEVPVMVYGIVSNVRNWLFLQWAGTENDLVLYVSKMQSCNFSNAEIMKMGAKNITTADSWIKHRMSSCSEETQIFTLNAHLIDNTRGACKSDVMLLLPAGNHHNVSSELFFNLFLPSSLVKQYVSWEIGYNCGCSKVIPREKFAELREAFQALSRSEQDIFLMTQLRAMNGGEITANRNTPLCQKTYLNMLGIGHTHFETVRNLATNGIIPRVHGNVKRIPRWKTKIIIDIIVATAMKNFLENYAEIHGLPSPGRNVNPVT
ncbi:hypothetical protein G9A89_010554 [Geosiphon pyriformis]|nr:hypothetical protein G9A89_010554 [Geosiphon pyriformis]